jgi:hypothetical protein
MMGTPYFGWHGGVSNPSGYMDMYGLSKFALVITYFL